MNIRKALKKVQEKRARRVRAKILGTAQRPRLSVFKSNSFVYLQAIDDENQKTIVNVSTRQVASKENKLEGAKILGDKIAKAFKEKGINEAIFDRGRYRFHGIIKTIVEGARKGGIKI
jgi:large subunit ribosomal protein L18